MLSCTDPSKSISILAQSILLDLHSLLQMTLVHREMLSPQNKQIISRDDDFYLDGGSTGL